eukprot:6196817-Pleurochrysis_carterae.AAC.1
MQRVESKEDVHRDHRVLGGVLDLPRTQLSRLPVGARELLRLVQEPAQHRCSQLLQPRRARQPRAARHSLQLDHALRRDAELGRDESQIVRDAGAQLQQRRVAEQRAERGQVRSQGRRMQDLHARVRQTHAADAEQDAGVAGGKLQQGDRT